MRARAECRVCEQSVRHCGVDRGRDHRARAGGAGAGAGEDRGA